MEAPPTKIREGQILKTSLIDTNTILGPMIAIGDDEALYLLEFVGRRGLEREIERLRTRTKSILVPGNTKTIQSIENELTLYFSGKLKVFKTPLFLLGTPFQKSVWEELVKIPFAETRSYAELTKAIGKPSAYRAVALANSTNQLALIIPCHRVINSNGDLCGYAGGITRKKWLLEHEKTRLSIY